MKDLSSDRKLAWTREGDTEYADHGPLRATIARLKSEREGRTIISVRVEPRGEGGSEVTPAYIEVAPADVDRQIALLKEKVGREMTDPGSSDDDDDEADKKTTAKVRAIQEPPRSDGLYRMRPERSAEVVARSSRAERRRHPRFFMGVPVSLVVGDDHRSAPAQLVDLSRGGCFLATPSADLAGRPVSLGLYDDQGTHCSATGRVVRDAGGHGIGIQFDAEDDRLAALIAAATSPSRDRRRPRILRAEAHIR